MVVHGIRHFCHDNAGTVINRGEVNTHIYCHSVWTERTGCTVGMYSIGRMANAYSQ